MARTPEGCGYGLGEANTHSWITGNKGGQERACCRQQRWHYAATAPLHPFLSAQGISCPRPTRKPRWERCTAWGNLETPRTPRERLGNSNSHRPARATPFPTIPAPLPARPTRRGRLPGLGLALRLRRRRRRRRSGTPAVGAGGPAWTFRGRRPIGGAPPSGRSWSVKCE